jgi:predicted PurR-regulated permease PerM
MTILFENNDILFYGLFTGMVGAVGYLIIKSYFYSTVIETPNSPPTFNLSPNQIKELNEILDKGDKLDKEIQDKVDQDFQTILGENADQFNQDIQEIQNDLENTLRDIFDSFL